MITVTDRILRTQKNFWNNIHFHPTDAIEDAWGQRILDEVAHDRAAQTVRMYAMLEDIVTLDENGNLHYDFTLNDTRMDYMAAHGFRLLVCYAFVPPCLALQPDLTASVSKNKTRYKGKLICTSLPRDYGEWEEICYQYTRHIVDRYGFDTVKTWVLQCYNEPDINCFFMGDLDNSPESVMRRLPEYLKLYRGFLRAVDRVDPRLKVCQSVALMTDFLEGFLKAVKEEKLRLDYVCIHNYGTDPAEITAGRKTLSVENTLRRHEKYRAVIDRYFPEKPVLTDEWGAVAWGFANRDDYPCVMFREDSRYAAFFGKMICAYVARQIKVEQMVLCLSGQHEMTTDFSGFRNFFTLNFIKKPIYNAFVLAAKLGEQLLESEGEEENLSVMATQHENGDRAVLLSYADRDFADLPPLETALEFSGEGEYEVFVWTIDRTHTNPYALYQKEGMKDPLSDEQLSRLQKEGTLVPLRRMVNVHERFTVPVSLSCDGFMLIEVKKR